MTERDFGQQLLFFRRQSLDHKTGKPLTQQQLGEQLGHELGRSAYTGAAVSDWERGKSRINADDRHLLLSLLYVLIRYEGVKNPNDANLLLEAGNFRALSEEERDGLFPGYKEEIEAPIPTQNLSNLQFLLDGLNFIPFTGYRAMLEKAKQGPPPYWPRVAVFTIRQFTDGLNAPVVLKGIIWFWIFWLANEFFIAPSLRWNFGSRESAVQAIILYAAGSLIIPALIGGLTNTGNNPYWIQQNMRNWTFLRLYTHQGAYVGYHTSYFLAFLLTQIQNILGLDIPIWSTLLETALVIIISYAGARLVPYNLWLAYGRLDLKDGGIFFIFAGLGPLWALFFLEFYETLASPALGGFVVLLALTIFVTLETLKHRKKASSQ